MKENRWAMCPGESVVSQSNHWSVLLLFLAAATLFYVLGFTTGAVVFITLGVGLEIAFWVRLFRGEKTRE